MNAILLEFDVSLPRGIAVIRRRRAFCLWDDRMLMASAVYRSADEPAVKNDSGIRLVFKVRQAQNLSWVRQLSSFRCRIDPSKLTYLQDQYCKNGEIMAPHSKGSYFYGYDLILPLLVTTY